MFVIKNLKLKEKTEITETQFNFRNSSADKWNRKTKLVLKPKEQNFDYILTALIRDV